MSRHCLNTTGITVVLATQFALLGCSGDEPDPTPQPPAPGVVLEIDGLQITRQEIDAWSPYFDVIDPGMGHKYRIRALLDNHLIPLHFARRRFAAERARMLEQSNALASITDNYVQLKRQGERLGKKPGIGGYEPDQPFPRNDLPLPVARWAFKDERLGMASKPIETAYGYTIIAGRDLLHGTSVTDDLLHAFVVNFNPITPAAFKTLFEEQRATMRVTYVHKDLQDALPKWLEL